MDGTTRTTGEHAGGLSKPLNNKATTDDFWKFCLQHHNKPEVQQACLALQEIHKGNINIALLLAWLEYSEYSLSKNSLAALRQSTKRTEPLLRRYRLLRREIKPQLTKGAYQKMLNFELALEKNQQQDLIECLNRQTWHPIEDSTLQYYCKHLDPDAQLLYPQLISRLIPNAFEDEPSPSTQTEHLETKQTQETSHQTQTLDKDSFAISPPSTPIDSNEAKPKSQLNTHSNTKSNPPEAQKTDQDKKQFTQANETQTQFILTTHNELEHTL